MKSNQNYSVYEKELVKEVVYFTNALAVDGFDISIRRSTSAESDSHAKVELLFIQGKGKDRLEVVSAVRMQVFEVEKLAELITEKLKEFYNKHETQS